MNIRDQIGRMSFPLVVAGGVLLVGMLSIFEWKVVATFDELQAGSLAQRSNLENIGGIEKLRIAIIDMETGVRGYLLAGDRRFLEPYERGQEAFRGQLQFMLKALGDKPRQMASMRILEQRESAWRLEYLQHMVERRARATSEREFAALRAEVATAVGKRRVDEMRGILDDMLDRESAEARAAGESLEDLLQRARHALLLSCAMLIAFAMLLTWVIFRSLLALRKHNAELIAENRARRDAEAALMHATEMQRAIFESADYAIIAIDAEGMVQAFNQAAERMFGIVADRVIGRQNLANFFLAEQLAARAREFSVELGKPVSPGPETLLLKSHLGLRNEHEWDMLRADGSTLVVQMSMAALRKDDFGVKGYVGIVHDISERRKMQRLKQEFVSTVSHELRTPLAAIMSALSLLDQGEAGDIPEPAHEFVRMAHEGSMRLAALVNDILDIDRIESPELALVPSTVALPELLAEALQHGRKQAERYAVQLHLDMPVPAASIRVDRDRLLQVLGHLLANACKFSPPGYAVRLAAGLYGSQARISVFDNGPGIPLSFRARIFDKFARADDSDTRQKGGTGLGLAISKALVARMGGRIGFESSAGLATEFYLEFPLAVE